jgi:hypothetical protein
MNNTFVTFMASPLGRLTHVVGGLVIIAWGLTALETGTGNTVALIGLVPLLAGIFDICLFAPLFGAPLSGKKIRGEA